MDRQALEAMSFVELKRMVELVGEVFEARRGEAERDYREAQRKLAAEWGFPIPGRVGRPKKKRKADKGNGHDTDAQGDSVLPS